MTEQTSEGRARKAFIPLECNPEVMTSMIHTLGVSPALAFADVYSIDDPELLSFVPRPAYALLLVAPVSEAYSTNKKAEDAERTPYTGKGEGEPVLWFRQTIKNACGMMGLLHAVSNGPAREFIQNDTPLDKLLTEAVPLSPTERAQLIETSDHLEAAHKDAASKGDTAAPDANDDVDLHYFCFVKGKDGHLYELDGSRSGPLDRGKLEEDEDVLSEKALKAVKVFIEREKGSNLNFSLVALVPGFD